MYIQYVGFDVIATSRIYTFRVIDVPRETREFTVKIQSEAVRWPSLKFQDGPGICFARVQRELDGETQGSRAEPQLSVNEKDIREYIERHCPPKRLSGAGG
jgi:hypothetical protein